MREALTYPNIDKEKLSHVRKLINRIAETIPSDDYSVELNELSCITGKIHEAIKFTEYWGWTDLDTLAIRTLTAEPPCIPDLTINEIKEIVSIIRTCFISGEDLNAEYYIELLHKSLPLTNVISYIMSEKDEAIEKAWFLSPVVDMQRIIENMMIWFQVTEEQLHER